MTSIVTAVIIFGVHPFTYKIELDLENIVKMATLIIVTYFICIAVTMQITYIAAIRGKMRKLTLENFTLFNKMHERLVVIS